MANAYRMTDPEISLMIQLRASNDAIFTGKKNSAMKGWRAINKEMGLQGLMTARQLKKKWVNLKDKYKMLKNPPAGMENVTSPSSWRWFHLMDQALNGQLAGSAKIIPLSQVEEDDEHNSFLAPLSPSNMEEDVSGLEVMEAVSLDGVAGLMEFTKVKVMESPSQLAQDLVEHMYVKGPERKPALHLSHTLPPLSDNHMMASSSGNVDQETAELDRKLSELLRERMVLQREQAELDRELMALEKDRELLSRDMATVQRERTAVDRDRAAVERDRALLDRDRAFLERDRAFLERDKMAHERAQEELERERLRLRRERDASVDSGPVEMLAGREVILQTRFYESLAAADLDPDQLETRQKLISLFQKLLEKL